ncbi:hypothetical protein [Rhodohalobacter mucosus]|uniref:Uncharacterized protein n=1 Tax=Rhodohalobacter mucosus TaxID=2079485 RepID=A0A316TNI1_9BACT|nr:hypothetical protein [Rhodohalobacter mucosus]PWN05338.1 hypothetical protein DDZ15_14825 [Rhodohalobacter mucosus]
MGKINLSSLKSCVESASQSFRKIEDEKPFEMHIVTGNNPDTVDSLIQSTQKMLKNIPTFSQTGS